MLGVTHISPFVNGIYAILPKAVLRISILRNFKLIVQAEGLPFASRHNVAFQVGWRFLGILTKSAKVISGYYSVITLVLFLGSFWEDRVVFLICKWHNWHSI